MGPHAVRGLASLASHGGGPPAGAGRTNRLKGFTDPTVFCEFTPLAAKLNALNLGQVRVAFVCACVCTLH